MNLTTAINQDYSLPTSEKNEVGCENLHGAAMSRKQNCLAAFFVSSGVSIMADRAGKPQGLPVLHRVLTPVSVCHLSVRRKVAVINPQMERIMTTLIIFTTKIRQLDGLYSLNDLHKAAGGKDKHRPTFFLRNEQTQELIAELNCVDSHSIGTDSETAGIPAVKTKEGKGGGTYVCRELVIAYAAWISAAFHLKVIQVFLSQSEPKALSRQNPKRYNYPRQLLGQPDFTTSDGMVRLDINMLADRKFISPLFGLLNELRADGHDVTAAMAEAEAMRQGLIKADEAFDQIWNIAIKTKVSPAKISERGKR